jgi:hypothetical protein
MSEIIAYAERLLTTIWGDLSQVVEEDAKTAIAFATTAFHQLAEDEAAILVNAADMAVSDFRANPTEILTPEQEFTRLLSYLGGQEVLELAKVTPEIAGWAIATAKVGNPAPAAAEQPAAPTQPPATA